jgi:molybdenum cofactor cytidylyltransferase
MIAAILLAGGQSRRMGRLKPLLDWGPPGGSAVTLVEYQVSQLRAAGCAPVIVVLGYGADEVRPAVHRAGAQAVINELYAEGRASSVRVGAGALPEATEAVVMLNADQPRPAWVTQRLLKAQRDSGRPIAVPTFQGHRGHPAVFSRALIPGLREVTEAGEGMREVLRAHEAELLEVEFDSPVVLLDLNRPEEYEEARGSFFRHSTATQEEGT